MTAYGYARVSTVDQDPQLQFDALMEAGVDYQHIYTDHLSGTRDDRPGLAAVLDVVGDGDSLTVWRLDRLGRSTSHLIHTIDSLGERGVDFRSLRDPIDTTSPAGRLMFRLIASIAQFEREVIQERTTAALAAARARGVRLGRRTSVSVEQFHHIHRLHENGWQQTQIAKVTGLSRAAVGRVVRGEIGQLAGLEPTSEFTDLPMWGQDAPEDAAARYPGLQSNPGAGEHGAEQSQYSRTAEHGRAAVGRVGGGS